MFVHRALFIFLALTVICAGPLNAQTQPGQDRPATVKTNANDMILAGKLFCSLKREVVMPFHCVITNMSVKVGQKVAQGDILAGFRLEPEVIQDLLRKTSGNHLLEMEVRNRELAQNLAELSRKRKEVKSLAGENLASAESLRQLDNQVALLASQKKAVLERLQREKSLFDDDLKLLGQRLGVELSPGHLPEEGFLTSPEAGSVVWINAQLRTGSEMGPGTKAVSIGVMDPLILIAQAHETEAVELKPGQEGFLVIKPFPDRRFKVTISRISWTPNNVQIDQPSYYQVEFIVPNPDFLLKEGFSGNVYINQ